MNNIQTVSPGGNSNWTILKGYLSVFLTSWLRGPPFNHPLQYLATPSHPLASPPVHSPSRPAFPTPRRGGFVG